MPRIRSLKYEYFINEDLAQISLEARLLGLGLTTIADREGRLEDRPLRIKVLLFPYHEVDVDTAINELQTAGFLERYSIEGKRYIRIVNFLKHQKPHPRETPSVIPDREKVNPRLAQGEPKNEKATKPSVKEVFCQTQPGGLGDLCLGDLGSSVSGNGDQQRAKRTPGVQGSRLPGDFSVTPEFREWAREHAPHVNIDSALDEFHDYWKGVPGAKGRKLDWSATFRNRVRDLEDRKNGRAVQASHPNAYVKGKMIT